MAAASRRATMAAAASRRATMAAAAVTLLRLSLARLSYHLRSVEEESAAEAEAPRSFVLPRLPRPKLSVKERKELASYAHGLGKKLKSQQVGKSSCSSAR